MAIEDEYELLYTHRQVREADGWQMSHQQVRFVDEDNYYISDRQVITPPPHPVTVTDSWTPNSLNVYVDGPDYDIRFRRFRYAPLT